MEHYTSYIKTIDAHDFAQRYRNAAYFEGLCRQCPNYGRRWSCPPIGSDCPDIQSFRYVTLLLVKIDIKQGTPADTATLEPIIRPARELFEPRLLKAERDLDGRACLFTGMCPHCPGLECARVSGEPCRHPGLVRPSLEALGLNLDATARDIFGIPMQWCSDGQAPPYLTLVGGVFHNEEHANERFGYK